MLVEIVGGHRSVFRSVLDWGSACGIWEMKREKRDRGMRFWGPGPRDPGRARDAVPPLLAPDF